MEPSLSIRSTRRPNFIIAACLLSALLFLLLLQGTAAQGPNGDSGDPDGTGTVDRTAINQVASELYCPLCSGLTVDICELEVCVDMRTIIGEKLAAGESPEQIQAYFVEQYGQQVAGKPSTQGLDLTAWVMPFVMLLLGAGIVMFWLRNRPSSPTTPAVAAPPSASMEEYNARLERELQRMEES